MVSMAFEDVPDWRAAYGTEETAMLSLHASLIERARKTFPVSSPEKSVKKPEGVMDDPRKTVSMLQRVAGHETSNSGPLVFDKRQASPAIIQRDLDDESKGANARRMRRKRAASPNEEYDSLSIETYVRAPDQELVSAKPAVRPPSIVLETPTTLNAELQQSLEKSSNAYRQKEIEDGNQRWRKLDEEDVTALVSTLSRELAALSIERSKAHETEEDIATKTSGRKDGSQVAQRKQDKVLSEMSAMQWIGIIKTLDSIRELSEGAVWNLAQRTAEVVGFGDSKEDVRQDSAVKRAHEIMQLAAKIVLADRKDIMGRSALHVAVQERRVQTLRALVSAQCAVNAELPLDYRVFRLLDAATKDDSLSENVSSYDPNFDRPNKKRSIRPGMGPTPLVEPWEKSTKDGHLTLGLKVPEPAPVGLRGATPLHLAAAHGFTEGVEILASSPSIDINARTASGDTALHCAAFAGHTDVVDILSATSNVDLNAANSMGVTPLHMAAAFGHTPIVEILWSRGGHVDPLDNFEWTPLHYAARNGHCGVAKHLVIAGSHVQHHDAEVWRVRYVCIYNK